MAARPEGLARFLSDKLVLGVCVLVSLWLISLEEDTRVRHAASLAHRITTPVEWSIQLLDGVVALRRENDELRARITSMELDAGQIVASRARIEELEARAGFYERSRGHLIPASVLELTVSRFPVQAKIRSFGPDSLRVMQPVVTNEGLVGRVSQVLAPNTALVQLLTDEECRISVESVRTGVLGLLRYDGRVFLLDHVPRGEPVDEGDELVTSGLGGTVPRGLPIGTVRAIQTSAAELFQHVEVEPGVRFSSLSKVFVVVRPGPWYARAGDSTLPPKPGDESDDLGVDEDVPLPGEQEARR